MKFTYQTLLFCIFFISATSAQNATEILANYTKVTGGQASWNNVTSMKVIGTAKLVSQNMELPFQRIQLKDGRQITSLKINERDYIDTAYDGTIVWGSNPQMETVIKDEDATENLKSTIPEFPYPAHNWMKNGFQSKYLGMATINGAITYKVKLTKNPLLVNGVLTENSMLYYFDRKTYLPVLTETTIQSGPSAGKVQQSYLSDYREVAGYYYPFVVTMKIDNTTFQILETSQLFFNENIADAIFKMPKP